MGTVQKMPVGIGDMLKWLEENGKIRPFKLV